MTVEKNENDPTWGFEGDSEEIRLVRAMYGGAVDHARQHTAKLDLQPERLRKAFKAARCEADRSAAILVFALAEDLMLDGIKRYINADVKGGWAEVTGGNGLLATANDRITFLYLLQWIQPSVYADLRLMKSIRNRFAHHADVSHFDDRVISGWISAMSDTEATALAAVPGARVERPTKPDARQLFLIRSTLVVTRLVANLAVAPQARASQVAPGHVEGQGWELYPDNLKELNRIAAEVILRVIDQSQPESTDRSPI
jgi:DNA-binding MltR family transcriptional regulator